MRNLRMLIEYDGTRYRGWQRLKGVENTIQGKLENVLSLMTDEVIEITGAGRTDAGVHARGQVANFKTQSSLTERQMLEYLLQYLPTDIIVKRIEEVGERFHSRYHAVEKRYTYHIWNHWIPSAFERKYSYHLGTPLRLEAMREAARSLLGTHDFIGFSSVKKTNKSTVRTIREITVEKTGPLLEISVVGDGFLHNMVRIVAGTLVEIGAGSLNPEVISQVLLEKRRETAGLTLPPHGLFLEEVVFLP